MKNRGGAMGDETNVQQKEIETKRNWKAEIEFIERELLLAGMKLEDDPFPSKKDYSTLIRQNEYYVFPVKHLRNFLGFPVYGYVARIGARAFRPDQFDAKDPDIYIKLEGSNVHSVSKRVRKETKRCHLCLESIIERYKQTFAATGELRKYF